MLAGIIKLTTKRFAIHKKKKKKITNKQPNNTLYIINNIYYGEGVKVLMSKK